MLFMLIGCITLILCRLVRASFIGKRHQEIIVGSELFIVSFFKSIPRKIYVTINQARGKAGGGGRFTVLFSNHSHGLL